MYIYIATAAFILWSASAMPATLKRVPTTLTFDQTEIGTTSALQYVTLSITSGSGTINDITFSVSGADASNFPTDTGVEACVQGQNLSGSETCRVYVAFTPSAKSYNSFAAVLGLNSSNGGAKTVDLAGTSRGCFNGAVEEPEECDDGNADNGDGCTDACLLEVCGDGIVNNAGLEECDDGNILDGDCCDSVCKFEPLGSACDDSNICSAIDQCDGAGLCTGEGSTCGNGSLEDGCGEECDDGNILDGDCCDSTCVFEPLESACNDSNICSAIDQCDGAGLCTGEGSTCGNGTLEDGCGEECDDGNLDNGDGCSAVCQTEFCGDGSINNAGLEECDDGNADNGDGCDSSCRIESATDDTADTTDAETTDSDGEDGGDNAETSTTGGATSETGGSSATGETSSDSASSTAGGGCSLIR